MHRPAHNTLTAPKTLYVSPTGNDATGDGSLAHPFATPTGSHLYALRNFNLAGFSDAAFPIPALLRLTPPPATE